MNLQNIFKFLGAILALFSSQSLTAQTCLINTGKLDHGNIVYTEVFEYDYVDIKPEFPGGGRSMINFINSNREYPHEAYESGIQGRVTCSFVVNVDGKLSNIKILRGVENSLNEEALRLIQIMPDWIPGSLNGTIVPVRVICNIPFRI